MKVVDVSEATAELSSLLAEVESGEEVLIARDGKAVARLSKVPSSDQKPINRNPGILADSPAWRDFRYDPAIFAPLETDEDLAAEGWPT